MPQSAPTLLNRPRRPCGRRAGRTEVAHGFVERDQPVASAPVIWLGVRLARANRMLDELLDELRIDARPTMSGEHTPRLHQAASKALTRLGALVRRRRAHRGGPPKPGSGRGGFRVAAWVGLGRPIPRQRQA